MKISILGMGSWGIALGIVLKKIGHDVMIWGRNEEKVAALEKNRVSEEYLPHIHLDEEILVTSSLEKALHHQENIVLSVSSQSVRSVIEKIDPFILPDQVVVSTSKGLERKTNMFMSDVIEEASKKTKVVVLSGPSHAEEVAIGLPTTIVASSRHKELAEQVQDVFMHPTFRVYVNNDVMGVELGGALKNVISLAAGISDGMGYGDNTKAALITRGMLEIARFGTKMGAHIETFYGLSGIGDLIVTCNSTHSRNWKAGYLLGQGKSLEETLEEVHMVVEGVYTTEAAYHLSQKLSVNMPITTSIYEVLFQGKSPQEAVRELMTRDKKAEGIEYY